MRVVLVTGATGAIGSVLTKYLLEEDGTELRLLIRARSREHLEERLRGLYRFWGIDAGNRSIASRVTALAGDVSDPGLGLERDVYHRLAAEVSHVIHAAGNVKLNRPIDEARRSAVDTTRHVLSFVEASRQAGPFQKLEFVSTVGVAGKLGGTIPERAIIEERTFNNSYEAAKAEAESLLFEQMHLGLPVTVHRPSMVVGDSTDGRIIQFQVFYYLCEFLSGRRTGGFIPDVQHFRLDIIPVDYVARCIQVSSRDVNASGRIFHLCSGSHAPEISTLARHVRRLFTAHGRSVSALHPVRTAWIRTLLPVATRFASGSLRRSLESLPYFLAYLDVPQTFGNEKSQEFFSALGINVPHVETYIDPVLSFYLAQKSGASASLACRVPRVA